MTEREAFVQQYEGSIAKRVAQDAWDAMHPTGMHTNGPTYVRVEISWCLRLLDRFKKASQETKSESPEGAQRRESVR